MQCLLLIDYCVNTNMHRKESPISYIMESERTHYSSTTELAEDS